MTNKFQSTIHSADQSQQGAFNYTQTNQYLDNAYYLLMSSCLIAAISFVAHLIFD